ncbi:Serine proteinase stubble [Halotydeus destructor]|nr:Serine proteinase stubble [Halotydeus destructor]
MIKVIAVSFILLLSLTKSNSKCGLSFSQKDDTDLTSAERQSTNFIYYGHEALPGDYPWMVSLQHVPHYHRAWHHFCGAAILSPRWLLTAAHCIEVIGKATKLRAVYGTIDIRRGKHSQPFSANNVFKPDQYVLWVWRHDIMLIRMETPLNLSNSSHNLTDISESSNEICLPKQGQNFLGMATVSGWGSVQDTSRLPAILRYVPVQILNASDCIRYTKIDQYDYIGPGMRDMKLCAGYRKGGKDACVGDSGGPLFTKSGDQAYVIGIVSHGRGCGKANYPGVYTRVSAYIDWIQEIVTRYNDSLRI